MPAVPPGPEPAETRPGQGREVGEVETRRANRQDWDRNADAYQAEHGAFLRDVGFVWCPEGLDEADAGLLGEVRGRTVLEVGCGAGQCGRWLLTRGAEAVGVDLSHRQLQHSSRIDGDTGLRLRVVCGTATALPFAAQSFDLAFSAYGALPFVRDVDAVLAEVRRVVRPGGRFVFSVSHPVRWTLPDDPGVGGLTVTHSYFDRSPYVETDDDGEVSSVEHHRTLGDWVRAVHGSGMTLVDLVEPEWPAGHGRSWGGWSPERGALTPGTAIFCCAV
jgi:SAM-dependent methyltransferase